MAYRNTIGARVSRAFKRGAGGVFAGLLMLIGLVFLSIAAWIVLVASHGTMMAAVIFGCAFVGLGIVILAGLMMTSRPRAHHAHPPHRKPDMVDDYVRLAEGFAAGLRAGRRTRGQGA